MFGFAQSTASDGCGAVMRVVAIPLVLSDNHLQKAAEISAKITHAHPDALASAVATCMILQNTLENKKLDVLRDNVNDLDDKILDLLRERAEISTYLLDGRSGGDQIGDPQEVAASLNHLCNMRNT